MSRAAAAFVTALLLTACAGPGDPGEPDEGGDRVSSASPSATAASPTDAAASPSDAGARPHRRAGTVVVTGDSAYGPMLFDRTMQAIYLFDKEQTSTPQCYGECAEAWPPVLTAGPPRAGRGADASLLGTVRRRDGSTQITYGGHPLYFYAHEGKNQVLCHDIREYGGLWLVVTPEGPPAPPES